MKIEQIKEQLRPIAERAEKDNDKYCFFYFSREQDGYSSGSKMDSGDALIVVTELMERYGINPAFVTVNPGQPFVSEFPAAKGERG